MLYKFQKIYQGFNYSQELTFADKLGLLLSFVGLFFIQISISLSVFIFYGALFSFAFGGHWREKLLICCSYKSAGSLAILLLLFFLGMFYSSAGYMVAGREFCSLLIMFMPFYLLLPLFQKKQWRLYAEYVFLAGVLCGVLNLLLWPWLSYLTYGHQFVKILIDPVSFSMILAFAAYVCFCNYKKASNIFRILYVLLAIIFIFTLYFVNIERTGMLVFMILLLYFIAENMTKKYKLPALLMVILGFVVVASVSYTWHQRLYRTYHQVTALFSHHRVLQNSLEFKGTHRLQYIKDTIRIIKKNPILGIGTGHLKQHHGVTTAASHYPTTSLTAENSYLDVTMQLGLVGLVAFLWFIFRLWREAELLPLADKRKLQGIIICLVVGSLFYPVFGDLRFSLMMTLFMAVYFASRYQSSL